MVPQKDENYSAYRQRLVEQFKTILKGRDDIRNIGIVRADKNSPSLFDNGVSVRNAYLDLNTQAWYADAVGNTISIISHLLMCRM